MIVNAVAKIEQARGEGGFLVDRFFEFQGIHLRIVIGLCTMFIHILDSRTEARLAAAFDFPRILESRVEADTSVRPESSSTTWA